MIIGTLAAVAAILAGLFFTEELSGEAGIMESKHAFLAFITTGLLIITCIFKLLSLIKQVKAPLFNKLAFVFYLLSMLAVSATGFFGGTLVYNYMMPL